MIKLHFGKGKTLKANNVLQVYGKSADARLAALDYILKIAEFPANSYLKYYYVDNGGECDHFVYWGNSRLHGMPKCDAYEETEGMLCMGTLVFTSSRRAGIHGTSDVVIHSTTLKNSRGFALTILYPTWESTYLVPPVLDKRTWEERSVEVD